jgi:hypothetical protein
MPVYLLHTHTHLHNTALHNPTCLPCLWPAHRVLADWHNRIKNAIVCFASYGLLCRLTAFTASGRWARGINAITGGSITEGLSLGNRSRPAVQPGLVLEFTFEFGLGSRAAVTVQSR